ncbi:hypothetical protein EC988_003224, partial [Linderina pennispora]
MSFGPSQLTTAAEQLDAKIAELEAVISSATNDAQARVSRDLKKAWESVYNALGYSPNPRGPGVHAHMTTAHSSNRPSATATLVASAMGAGPHSYTSPPNVPLEPEEAQAHSPAHVGPTGLNRIGTRNECSKCKKAATDVLWVCISCADHRLCNTCKDSTEVKGTHRMVAWAIDKSTIAKGHYIVCDDCSKPVVGLRWNCTECPSFDVCNDCAKDTTHEHKLKALYYAETATFPYGSVGYSCNLCGSTATPPIYCCLHCKDFHVCSKCVVSDKISEHDHDYAALCIPANALAPTSAPEPAGKVAVEDTPADDKQTVTSTSETSCANDGIASVVCDGCESSITGIRHKCTRCKNYDLCDGCYRNVTKVHPGHGFIHFGPPAHPPHHHRPHHHKRHGHYGPRPFQHSPHGFHDHTHSHAAAEHWRMRDSPRKACQEQQEACRKHAKHTPHVPPFPGRPSHHRHDFRCPPGQSPGSLGLPPLPPPPPPCQFNPPAHPPPPPPPHPMPKWNQLFAPIRDSWGFGWGGPTRCPPPRVTPVNCTMPPLPPMAADGTYVTDSAEEARRHGLAISSEEKQQQTNITPSVERGTSTDSASVQVVHPGVLCDSCGDLVTGVRYKCGNCSDFDLCEKCEAKTSHDKSHIFVKIRNPSVVPSRVPMLSQVYRPLKLHVDSPSRAALERAPSMPTTAKEATARWNAASAGAAAAAAATAVAAVSLKGTSVGQAVTTVATSDLPEDKEGMKEGVSSKEPEAAAATAVALRINETTKYAAHFVEDVTIPDGTTVGAGEPFVKIWSVANMSEHEWPQGTMLVHMDGQPMIPGGKKAVTVIVGKCYEQVGVAVDLVAPEMPGKYISKWRLMTPTGNYFGSSLWCSIVVPEVASASPAADLFPQLAICPPKIEYEGERAEGSNASPAADSFPRLAICPPKIDYKGKDVEVASTTTPESVAASETASKSTSETASKTASEAVSETTSDIVSVAADADDDEDAVVIDVAAEPETKGERAVPEAPKIASAAPSEQLSTSESIASLTNTFVQISADLMKEIQRLDSSIKEIQAKQNASDKQPFDITSAPNMSETPIKGYPAASPSRPFMNVDLLTSPPFTFAPSHPSLQPSAPPMADSPRHASAPDAMSEHSSVREFLASTDRLNRL